MAAAYLIIADTVLYCCGRRDHPIGDGRSDGHSEAQRTCAAESSEPDLTLFPVWEKQVFWERIFPGIGKRGKKGEATTFFPLLGKVGNPTFPTSHFYHFSHYSFSHFRSCHYKEYYISSTCFFNGNVSLQGTYAAMVSAVGRT